MNKLQASLFTLAGGISYGFLPGFAKMAYKNGVETGPLTTLQYLLGSTFLWSLAILIEGRPWAESSNLNWSRIKKLVPVGFLSGVTGALYYLALTTLPAALGIILLFQFTWMGVLLEMVLEGRKPGKYSILALVLLIPGTVLAVGTGWQMESIPWLGIGLGLLSAVTYTGFLYGSGKVAVEVSPWTRSAVIVTAALLTNILIFSPGYLSTGSLGSNLGQVVLWSGLMAIFGPLIPTICFAYGVPHIGGGLASMLAAVELPTVIILAGLVLGEQTSALQWLGVGIILTGIFVSQRRETERSEI